MKPFYNTTNNGQEKAIRKGRSVPEGDVNLSYVKAPELSPKNNVVIVDTSRIVEENVSSDTHGCKIYYANDIGILVDDKGNALVDDEYPAVTDVFSIDEDFARVPGSEYKKKHVLPFCHVSRYFHLDHAGLTIGGDLITYKDDAIKVIDKKGAEYHNYKIKITPAYLPGEEATGSSWAYRVFVYIDTQQNEDLYLTYNKVELTDDAELVRRNVGHREILNPEPFFSYVPEESEVVDPANRDDKIYSTKPPSLASQITGKSSGVDDGYKIYVPKKAVGDPRLYQLFRWRISCTFTQDVRSATTRADRKIRCGVLVSNNDLKAIVPSRAPYALYNLSRSRYNAAGLTFENPQKRDHSASAKRERDYWLVNVERDDLSQYDLLIWAPNKHDYNFSAFAAKVDSFVSNNGGTVFIDTNSFVYGGTSLSGRTSVGFSSVKGTPNTSPNPTGGSVRIPARSDLPRWGDMEHPLVDGNRRLGGWEFMTSLEERLFIEEHGLQYNGSSPITRAEFAWAIVTIMRNIHNFTLPAHRRNAFPDVTSSTKYSGSIERLASVGVVRGNQNGLFLPTRNVTRAQAAAMVARAYDVIASQFMQVNPLPSGDKNRYPDVGSNFVLIDELASLWEAGIMVGYPDGTFRPNNDLTHTQTANMFKRLLDHLRDQAGIVSDIANNEDIYYMSFNQRTQPGRTSHFAARPSGYTTLIEAPLDEPPNYGRYRALTVARDFGSGTKILSTFGHLQTCSRVYSNINGAQINTNATGTAYTGDGYIAGINGIYVEGAMKLLYNAALLSLKRSASADSTEDTFSTAWTYSTPWKASWVIDPDVLNAKEKDEHNFIRNRRRLSQKSIKALVDETIAPIQNNPNTRHRVQGARSYRMEITNPKVKTESKVREGFSPFAWTDEYSPEFTVPAELGPHIITTEDKEAEYEEEHRYHYEYPERPYRVRVSASYVQSEENLENNHTSYVASGNLVATIRITSRTPASSTTTTSDVELNWWDEAIENSSRPYGNQFTEGSMFETMYNYPYRGMIKPVGITAWQEQNYYTSGWGPGHLAWPYWGMTRRLVRGDTGDLIRFVQDALNRFRRAGFVTNKVLSIDGVFGPATQTAIRNFQSELKARYVDGVIDAETWAIFGWQIVRLRKNAAAGVSGSSMPNMNATNYLRYYQNFNRMYPSRMSDGNNGLGIGKRTWRSGGPSVAWELYSITFKNTYSFHGVTLNPWTGGSTDNIMFRYLHVARTQHNQPNLTNYDSYAKRNRTLKEMPHRPRDGRRFYLPFGPWSGNTIIIGIGQDKSSGFGSSRMFGIRELTAHARVTTTTNIAAKENVTHQQRTVNFTINGSLNLTSLEVRGIQLAWPLKEEYTRVSSVTFTGITVDNPNVVADITTTGFATFRSGTVANDSDGDVYRAGPILPGNLSGQYRSMDENRKRFSAPEVGVISKSDGIKLLTTNNYTPIGFPSTPGGVGPNESQRHYVKLSINSFGTDPRINVGFYDVNEKKFITSADGKAQMSYQEYLRRGPKNIFIGIVSQLREEESRAVPVDDAPMLPHRTAMPVYGVCTRAGSRITLEPLPDKLGPRDVWPVAVRDGHFSRSVAIRTRNRGPLSGWLSFYQGSTVEAFYGLPEVGASSYSSKYGPPIVEVFDEEPMILDDDVIQIRQAPILAEKIPTLHPSLADPVRPKFKFFKRETYNSPWIEQPWNEIKDYNITTGEIFLTTPLRSNDESLLRVDYASTRGSYYFKKFEDQLINLNSYSGHAKDLAGEAIYIYIVPKYVKDSSGSVIPASVEETALRMTLDPSVFDTLSPNYNPLAVQLGVVYMSTALDVSEIGMFDTRRRGGGIKDNMNEREIARIVNDSATYWDVRHAGAGSYQKAGFLIIRLPQELNQHFTENEIREVIQRNITAGVGFKIEDLNGRAWSS